MQQIHNVRSTLCQVSNGIKTLIIKSVSTTCWMKLFLGLIFCSYYFFVFWPIRKILNFYFKSCISSAYPIHTAAIYIFFIQLIDILQSFFIYSAYTLSYYHMDICFWMETCMLYIVLIIIMFFNSIIFFIIIVMIM